MISLLRLRRSAAACIAVCAVFLAACDTDGGLAAGLPVGTWVSAWGETYQITETTFTSLYYDDESETNLISYKGNITNIRADFSGAGYITIRFTTPGYMQTAGRFYVIRWRGNTGDSVELSGAYIAGSPDTATQAEAEALFTEANGAFEYFSACEKQ